MKQYYLGIDIGGTFIKYAVVDKDYNIIKKWKVNSVKFDTTDKFYDYLCSHAKDLSQVQKIGISAPGLIDQESNVKSHAAPNVQIMYGTNVNQEVSNRTGKKVATINDAKAAGLCELKIGNAKNTTSSAFLIIGTGTGGCICNEEDVIYGTDGFAGEFHHLPFINLKDNSIARQGDYSSISTLIEIYNSNVSEKDEIEYGEEVTHKYLAENKIAKSAIEEWITNITVQLLTITTFYNPEVICIGGGISEEEWFIKLLRAEFKDICNDYFKETTPITTQLKQCKYTNDANILGAVINATRSK
ncbi:ROK family protein [Halanaerobaculum tunisiense]